MKIKKKKHIIISVDAEKVFDKIQNPFRIKKEKRKEKPPQKVGIEETHFNIIKVIYDNPQLTSYTMVKN